MAVEGSKSYTDKKLEVLKGSSRIQFSCMIKNHHRKAPGSPMFTFSSLILRL